MQREDFNADVLNLGPITFTIVAGSKQNKLASARFLFFCRENTGAMVRGLVPNVAGILEVREWL